MTDFNNDIENDQIAVKNNYVAITPIHFDLTDYEVFNSLEDWNLSSIK